MKITSITKRHIVIFLVGIAVIAICFSLYEKKSKSIYNPSCPDKYKYISPDLNCIEDPENQTVSLQQSVQSVVDNDTTAGEVDTVSIFYRDLNTKQWFGINENDSFAPGSLLKLPLAIAYYKLSEIEPDILAKQYTYTQDKKLGDLNTLQNVIPKDPLVSGTAYSIDDLITHMVKYSDNNAVPLLNGIIDPGFLSKVYVDLGVYIPTSGGIEQDFITVKTYGGILRTLYTASYLNQASSNKLLGIMDDSSFQDGLAAGVPSTVTVANKFGERFLNSSTPGIPTDFELHDCGILYPPQNPYILCVMTKGNDYTKLAKVIADVSRAVYQNR